MKNSIPNAPEGAKAPVHLTPGQLSFYSEVRDAVDLIERRGERLMHVRRGSPEQVGLRYLVYAMRDALRLVELARAEERQLDVRFTPEWSLPILVVGARPCKVIDLAEYRAKHR